VLAGLPEEDIDFSRPQAHIYSRYSIESRNRAEAVLGTLLGGYAVMYASGLSAAYAAVLHYQPTTIAIRRGYFGCHESFNVYAKTKGNVVSSSLVRCMRWGLKSHLLSRNLSTWTSRTLPRAALSLSGLKHP
jgi:hypothetical protein